MNTIPTDYRIHGGTPWWVYCIKLLEDGLPKFKGKGKLLSLTRRYVARKRSVFPWQMKNLSTIGISTGDLLGRCGVGWTCFCTGSWEPHVEGCLRTLIKQDDIVLDIGANIGYFTSVMDECVGSGGKVYAFEPVPDTFAQLKSTIAYNNNGNSYPFQIALGEIADNKKITYNPELSGNASLHREPTANTREVSVSIETIDSLFENGLLGKCQLIKIDVEGHEMSVFRGGSKYLKQCRPIVIYEFNRDTAAAAGYTLNEIQAEIDSWGGDYQHFLIWERGCLMEVDMKSINVPDGCYADFVAIPRTHTSL